MKTEIYKYPFSHPAVLIKQWFANMNPSGNHQKKSAVAQTTSKNFALDWLNGSIYKAQSRCCAYTIWLFSTSILLKRLLPWCQQCLAFVVIKMISESHNKFESITVMDMLLLLKCVCFVNVFVNQLSILAKYQPAKSSNSNASELCIVIKNI